MNRRRAKVYRQGTGTVLVLPKSWCDGEDVRPGDLVEVTWNGIVHIRKLRGRGF